MARPEIEFMKPSLKISYAKDLRIEISCFLSIWLDTKLVEGERCFCGGIGGKGGLGAF